MKQNNNAEYWHKRFELLEKAEYNKSAEYVKYLEKIYGQAISNCEAEIAKWYQRIAVNNAITYQEAKKLLSRDELKEFRWSIEEYIKYGETNGVLSDWSKELENVSAKVHISRLEAMKIQMQQQVEIVIAKQAESISILLNDIYKDSYYRSIFEFQKGFGVGSSFSILDDKTVAKILSKPWTADNRTFSQRIWGKHRPELIDKLQKDLAQNFIAGENPQKLVAKITKDFGVTKSQASNLAFTESAFFRSAGQKKSYQELGVDEYISKPFSPKILVARVEAILKRTKGDSKEPKDYDGIEIDKEGRTVKVDGKVIELSLREYELLVYLVENENIALSRDKILNNVWNYDYYGDSRTIDSHIKKLRHKLGKRGKYIKTMRGLGYKFERK